MTRMSKLHPAPPQPVVLVTTPGFAPVPVRQADAASYAGRRRVRSITTGTNSSR
jgi:hypothetical protein